MAKGSYKSQLNSLGGDSPFAFRGLLTKTVSNQPSIGPLGRPIRAFHTGRAAQAPVANRPLSPHLPIKKPQFSASFSISHRIFGAVLGTVIMAVPLAVKFSHQFDV